GTGGLPPYAVRLGRRRLLALLGVGGPERGRLAGTLDHGPRHAGARNLAAGGGDTSTSGAGQPGRAADRLVWVGAGGARPRTLSATGPGLGRLARPYPACPGGGRSRRPAGG